MMSHLKSTNGKSNLLSPEEARTLVSSEKILLIDVRERDEFAAETIEGAQNYPLSNLDIQNIKKKSEDYDDVLIFCLSGGRSADAAKRLAGAGVEVNQIAGGIKGWKSAGLATRKAEGRTTISIMRQVQLTIGVMNILGFLLAWHISPYFLFIPIFTSCGLLFAGLTGTCGLALFIGMMPWNKAPQLTSTS